MLSLNDQTLFLWPKYLLFGSGLWRHKFDRTLKGRIKAGYQIYSFFGQFMYFLVTLSLATEFFNAFAVDMEKALENLSKTLYALLLLIKTFGCQTTGMVDLTMSCMQEEIKLILTDNIKIRKTYQNEIRYANGMAKLIIAASFATCCDLVQTSVYDMYYRPYNKRVASRMPLQLALPFDQDKFPNLAFTLQIYGIVWTAVITASVFTFYSSIMIFLAARFKVLQHEMKHFCDCSDVKTELINIIKRHQRLIRSVESFNKSSSVVFFLEYMISSVLMALTVIQILSGTKPVFHFMYFWMIYAQLFTSCWNANEFTVQSTKLADALYASDWVLQEKSVKTIFYIMLIRCQRPVSVYLAPLMPLEASAALSRLKLVYSYTSLMSSRIEQLSYQF